MSKFLIDASNRKGITVYMDGKLLERVIRIDGVQKGSEDEMAEITLTFLIDDLKLKDTDGRLLDVLNGYSEVVHE